MIRTGGSANEERLRRIEAFTDAALSLLDTDDLLDLLLERVRELLSVDTAAILLLDQDAGQLVATAAKGLEEEVRQGFRLNLGQGFAGHIATSRQPLIIDRVTADNVANPQLLRQGLRCLLGVPMLAVGDLVGVLHVGCYTRRKFTEEDTRLLQMVADRAALAVRARGNYVDRTAALALQRSLLPTRLPTVPGVEFAARYVPGHRAGVGGDWYDVFTLPDGSVGVVVGDVSGHGLQAAVVMGRLRSALRAYALECDTPADALTRLDRKIHHFETGNLATVLYAMIDPGRSRMRVSLGGHPAPILAAPGALPTVMSLPVDLPLGMGNEQPRRSTDVVLPAGATVVCYTDGLVERRGEIIDTGLGRLCAAITPAPPETLCTIIMAALGVERLPDDVALLALRRIPAATSPIR